METKVTVTVGQEAASEPLPVLTVEGFATNAFGMALLTLESWEAVKTVRSERPLVAVLPGNKLDQVRLHEAVPTHCVVTKEVILLHKKSELDGEQKRFAKTVTIINHMAHPQAAVLNLAHGAQDIKLETRYNYQLFGDFFGDTAPPTQLWNNESLRQTFQSTVDAWHVKGSYNFQWISLRFHKDTNKATVMLRADEPARRDLLRNSGRNLIFIRERQVEHGGPKDYVPVWLQHQQDGGAPLGQSQCDCE